MGMITTNIKPVKMIKLVFLLFIVVESLFPILWTFNNSFRTNTQILSAFSLFPEEFNISNYMSIFKNSKIPLAFWNSLVITGSVLALTTFCTLTCSYVLARYRFKAAHYIYIFFISGVFVPGITMMGMTYKLLDQLHLLGTRMGIVLLYTSSRLPLSIFLMVAFMRIIPESLEEAAVLDGCNTWNLFTRIIVPLSRNGLVSVLILSFIAVWNDYILALVLLPSKAQRTLTVALAFVKDEYYTDYGLMSASIMVGVIPIVIGYVFLQDRLIKGITAASVKG